MLTVAEIAHRLVHSEWEAWLRGYGGQTSLLCSVIVHQPGGQNVTITRHRN